MKYTVVSDSEIRSKAMFNLVKDYFSDSSGTFLIGSYDMDYLLFEDLEFLFFDAKYYIDYKKKILGDKVKVKNLVLISLEKDFIDLDKRIILIHGDTSIDEFENLFVFKKEKVDFNLDDRDKSILYLLCEGHSNKDIGRKLYLSEKTIKNNLTRIYKKLGVKGKYEAITLLLRKN